MNGASIPLLLLAVSGALAGAAGRHDRAAVRIGCGGALAALLTVMFGPVLQVEMSGSLLANWFQIPICAVGIAAALHSPGYLDGHARGRVGLYWLFFNLTLAAMLAVTMASGVLTFLVAWELMGLFSFVLVAFEWHSAETRRAAWIYLVACEAGGLLLIAALAFGNWSELARFVLLLTAFGLKAGFPLLHVWLPDAHPAAPAPVSAVMSAAMIPLGFYGIFTWAPGCLDWNFAGWVLLILGMAGAFGGILFGLAQANLKRLLAYSSVENIGIAALAFGLGILGRGIENPLMSALAFAGGYLHILNHALLKGTLFLGAGSVFKATRSLDMDRMGGLMKKMPWTGGIFTLSALGISGLPPFCGFTGELLIYLAAFQGVAGASGALFTGSLAAVVVLAMTGGAAGVAFAKSIAAVFSGEPRSAEAVHATREEPRMIFPQLLLTAVALAIPWAAPRLAAGPLARLAEVDNPEILSQLTAPLVGNGMFGLAVVILTGILLLVRYRGLKRGRENVIRGTWDCGYAQPTPRMEYTATAFSQPVADLFNGILRQRRNVRAPEGLFPQYAKIEVVTPDGGTRWLWRPLFRAVGNLADRIHRFQSGYLHLYILVMVLAVLSMLAWGFGCAGEGGDL